ncbi:MAG: glycogen/starch synthase [Candidatus Aenigmatarchaeota archaeon]
MKVAFCSSEVFPFAKTGGLADVSGALPLALAKQKCQVKVFMPLYKNIKPQKVFGEFGLTKEKNVEFIFIKNDNFFMRDALYGTPQGDYPDNLERFSFFCRQVLEILKKLNFSPDIIHSNDWQASLVNIYLKTLYKNDNFFKNTKCLLTIHNLAYQGLFDVEKYPIIGLGWEYFNMHCLEFYGKVNLLKGGIVFSDMINTVSPTYAKQIQTPDYGCGLDGVLREKRDRLVGILNAIDYSVWDPKIDKLIYKNYSPLDLENKYENKIKFQKELGLKVDKNILFLGMVSRLAEQKGIDILSEALPQILKKYQVVILGFGDEKYHTILKKLTTKFKKNFSLNLKFDEVLAHKIYAGCDCFLMPSKFEPCGLSQMISYKYATVPIVHHTGGLADTVIDVNEDGGGFVFHNYDPQDLIFTVERAQGLFLQKKLWQNLLKKITKYNFSWEVTASKYIEIYKKCQSLL